MCSDNRLRPPCATLAWRRLGVACIHMPCVAGVALLAGLQGRQIGADHCLLFAHTGCSSHLIPKFVLPNMFPKSWLGDKKDYCVAQWWPCFCSTHIAARNSAVDVFTATVFEKVLPDGMASRLLLGLYRDGLLLAPFARSYCWLLLLLPAPS